MGRNYLKGREGDRINAVLAAASFNFSLLLRWFQRLLRALLAALFRAVVSPRFAQSDEGLLSSRTTFYAGRYFECQFEAVSTIGWRYAV